MKYLKGAGAFALGLCMLTLGEAAGLNVHGLNPQLRQVIGNLADARPVILARCPYTVLNTNPIGTQFVTVLSFTFPPYSLAAGDMIRVVVSGVAINNNAGAVALGVTAQAANGGGSFVSLGGGTANIPPAAGNPNKFVEWRATFDYSVGVAGFAPGANYIPQINSSAVTVGSTYSSGNQPTDAIQFYGAGWLFMTDAAASGAVYSGGTLITAATQALGLQRPFTYQNSLPIEIDIQVNVPSYVLAPVTINAGVMEGL